MSINENYLTKTVSLPQNDKSMSHNYKVYVMSLAQKESVEPEYNKRIQRISDNINHNQNFLKQHNINYRRAMGGFVFIKNNREYLLYPTFLVERLTPNDDKVRIVYHYGKGDTYETIVKKCKFLNIYPECKLIIEGMNLKRKQAH